MEIEALCGNCRYYKINPREVDSGLCHHNPPEPAMVGGDPRGPQIIGLRSPVKNDEMGCSKFYPQERLLKPGEN
jgi:hypothetical protein